ncbi:MAG: chemotaxis protein CheA [Rhodobacteraceae bacterium]|nr:chemotaxis protein CheA [Paracoccaceae bacterium]
MVQNSKVLTVSYGTFSCTLEGFEDSFETMKAIAEYFRDLAADDRYFGAEPPQPDADMLARIAEREISRQVEARRESGGIVLRAADLAAASPALARAISAQAQTDRAAPFVPAADDGEDAQPDAADREDATEPRAEAGAAPTPEAGVDAQAAATPEPGVGAESEASAGPEAAIQPDTAEIAAPADPDILPEPEIAGAAQIPDQDQLAADPAIMPVADEPEAAQAPETPADATHDATEDRDDDLPAATDLPAEDVDESFVPAADSIAAKLQRIRAVVSRNEQAETEDDYSEDQHAEAFTAQAAGDIMHALQDDHGQAEDGDVPDGDDNAYDGEYDQDGDADIAAILERLEGGEPTVTVSYGDEPDDEAQAASGESLFDDLDGEEDAPERDDDLTNIMGDAQEGETDAPERPASAPAAARVVKIKRSEFDAAIASGHLEEFEDEDETADDIGSSLSDEEEADLIRELADVEAEFAVTVEARTEIAVEAAAEDGAADRETAQGHGGEDEAGQEDDAGAQRPRRPLSASMDEDEDDFSRLMEQAGEKLSDPEAAARHETYSHMRAAVATTKAERSAGGTMGSHTDHDPYRDDLASVVRPRRPEAPQSRPQRPSTDMRPAPLKLVAEQRVDDGAGAAARGPVHPRRVSTRILEETERTGTPTPEGGFAEFAAEVGATELPDLLEAAAAYMSFVEGRAQFSRPQLMGKVRQVETTDFNREDGLRSFGQLLRDGKIEKKGGGRFAASSRIGFRPDDERAVG